MLTMRVVAIIMFFATILSAQPNAPSAVTATGVDIDSLVVNWTDNSSDESGFVMRVSQNGGSNLYFSTAANVTADTLAPWWPPASLFDVTVGAFASADTSWSSTVTANTDPRTPPVMMHSWTSDTSALVYLNGPILTDRFTDRNYSSSPAWTVEDGSFEIHTLDRQLRTTAADTCLIRTTYSAGGDSTNDGIWQFNFKLTDSTAAASQWFKMHLMAQKSSVIDSSYYAVKVMGKDSIKVFEADNSGAETLLVGVSGWIGTQEEFKLHELKVVREFDASPQDTTVLFYVYVDDVLMTTFSDETLTRSEYLAFSSYGATDTRFDDVIVKQSTPSGNDPTALYAIQDAVSATYVVSNAVGSALEGWLTFSEYGGESGYAVTNLVADTNYSFRSKARAGEGPVIYLITDAGSFLVTDGGLKIVAN